MNPQQTTRPDRATFDARRAIDLFLQAAHRMALGGLAPQNYILYVTPDVAARMEPWADAVGVELRRQVLRRLVRAGLEVRAVDVQVRTDGALQPGGMAALAFASRGPARGWRLLTWLPDGHPGGAVPLRSGIVTVGRGAECDVVLADPAVSLSHLEFLLADGLFLRDTGSKNGTVVNGRPLKEGEEVQLSEGDEVRCGRCVLRVEEVDRGDR